jgi:prepilin-type N-terminal cleavage/methylation domain-containing protein
MSVRGKKQGFTLLEVLVAMAILGIGLIVIIELFSGGLRLGRTSEEYTRAVGYARMKLEEISLAKTLEEGIEEGEFDREYRWQVEVKKVDLLPPGRETIYQPAVTLYWVRIEVLWQSGIRERATALESYRVLKAEESGQRT